MKIIFRNSKYLQLVLIFLIFVSNTFATKEKDNKLVKYENNVIGFQISYYKNWVTLDSKSLATNLNNLTTKDSNFTKLLQTNASLPFFAISKYQEPHDDLNPSLRVNARPLGGLKGKSMVEIIKIIIPNFQKIYEDFKIIDEPKIIKINNIEMAYTKFYYILKNTDGKEFKSCSELWLIDKGDFFIMIGAGSKQDESNGKRQEIQDMINTIKIN